MTMQRQALGKTGEDLAVEELERRGYAILARRYRTRHGEIDIVARDGETTVFVEVKARADAECGTAAEAVTPCEAAAAGVDGGGLSGAQSADGPAVPVRRRGDRRGRSGPDDHGLSVGIRGVVRSAVARHARGRVAW